MENIIYNKFQENIQDITNLIRKAKGKNKKHLLDVRAELQKDLNIFLQNRNDNQFIKYFIQLFNNKYNNIKKIESNEYKKDLSKVQNKLKQKIKGGNIEDYSPEGVYANKVGYKKLKVKELKQQAKDKKIKGYSKLKKAELIDLLSKHVNVEDVKKEILDKIEPIKKEDVVEKVETIEDFLNAEPTLWEQRVLKTNRNTRFLKLNNLNKQDQFKFILKYPEFYREAFNLSGEKEKRIKQLNYLADKIKKSKSLINQLLNGVKLVAIIENNPELEDEQDYIDGYDKIKQLIEKHKNRFVEKELKKQEANKFEPDIKKKRGRRKQELRRGLRITYEDFKKFAEINNYEKGNKKALLEIAKLAGINSPQKLSKEQLREIITDIIVNKKGAGIFDDFKGLINKGINTVSKGFNTVKSFFDPYKELRPIAQKIIKEQGNKRVIKIYAFRKPVMEVLNKVLNLVSLGKFEEGKKLSNYDEMYHLGLIFQLEAPQGLSGTNDNTFIMTEKNERIDMEIIKAGDVRKYGELFPITVNKEITFGQIMENTKNGMGNKFLPYDPFMGNNCQVYAMSLLKYSDLLTPEAEAFIFQPLDTILKTIPKSTPKVARAITQLGAFFANIGSKITGRGEPMKGGRKGETYAQTRAREAKQAEEMKRKNEEAKSKAYERTAKQAKSAKLFRLIKEMKDKKNIVEDRLKNLTPDKREAIVKIYEDDIKKVQDYDFYNISNENLKNQLMNQYYTMIENMNHSPRTYGELPKKYINDVNNPISIKYVYDNYGKVEPDFWGDVFPSIVSGLVSFIPVVGTVASTAMDVGLDILKNSQTEEKGKDLQDVNYDVLQQDTVNQLQDFDRALQQSQQQQEQVNNQLLSYEQERQQIENALSGASSRSEATALRGTGKDGYDLHAVIIKGLNTEEAQKIARDYIKNKKRKFSRITKSGSMRFRNVPKTKFIKKSFRTKIINPNVSLVYGKLK